MPAAPSRASLFPAGSLAPSAAKVLWGDFFDFVTGLLGTAGTAASARSALGVPLRGYLAGLTLSTAGSSATFAVAAGEAADSAGAALLQLAAGVNKTTSPWAVGTGNGALDSGTISNNAWYHVYLIRRPDTGVVDVVASTGGAGPTLPANYTQYRRIGAMRTNGSAQWTSFVQDGDLFQWLTPTLDVNVTSAGTAAVTRTLTVPSGINVRALCNAGGTAGVSGEAIYLSDLATTDLAPSNGVPLTTASIAANLSGHWQAVVRTNTSAQVRSRCIVGGASETLRIATLGWFDSRGREV
jgi:hypothetical protein